MTNSINRRDFLKRVGLAGSATVISPYAIASQNREIDCIVLGAGMAGITAARYMTDAGLSVRVLEGSGEIGGRISTYHGSSKGRNVSLDLGGEFVHREKDSVPLWGEIHKYGLPYEVIPKRKHGYMYHPAMGKKSLKNFTMAGTNWGPIKSLNVFRQIAKVKCEDMSALEFINQHAENEKDFDFMSMILSGHLPGSLEDLSVMGFNSDDIATQIRGKYDYHLYGGYDSLLGRLAEGLDIRTDERVQRISYGKESVIINTDNHEYKAKTAVCSFSIGMLKSGNVEFSPELPSIKKDALEFINPGQQSKIILEFSERFWIENASMFHRIDKERKSSGRSYFNLHYGEENMPPMLTAIFVGDDAKNLKRKSTKRAVRDICSDLDAMFPEAAPTFDCIARGDDAVPIVRKEWIDDPFSMGGISYLCVNETERVKVQEARKVLADARTTPRLFWAGEASELATQPTSVHGAHSTGLRASEEILRYLSSEEILNPEVSSQIILSRYEDSLPKEPIRHIGRNL